MCLRMSRVLIKCQSDVREDMGKQRRHGAQPQMKSAKRGLGARATNKQNESFPVAGNLPFFASVATDALLAKMK